MQGCGLYRHPESALLGLLGAAVDLLASLLLHA